MNLETKKRLWSLGILGVGLSIGWASVNDLSAFYDGLHTHSQVIVSEPLALAGVILSVMALTFAAIFLVPEPKGPPAERDRDPAFQRARAWTVRGLMLAAGCLIAAGFAPSIQYTLLDSAARELGYSLCPHLHYPRRQPDRWALRGPKGALQYCPPEGTPAHS